MILFTSGSTLVREFGPQQWLGQLLTPRSRNRIVLPLWAADNGAFGSFDARAYLRLVESIATQPTRPRFVTVPDAVGDAWETMARWELWTRILCAFRLPLAYVLQDGVQNIGVPWDDIAAVFVGGTTSFKVGAVARRCVEEARRQGKWVHMGRVNTIRRLIYAQQIGCDSVDGSGFARYPKTMIARFTRVNGNHILPDVHELPAEDRPPGRYRREECR
jgi:hypothetical protein